MLLHISVILTQIFVLSIISADKSVNIVIFSKGNDRFGEIYERKFGKILRMMYASHNLVWDMTGLEIAMSIILKSFDTPIQPIINNGGEVCYDSKLRNWWESLHVSYVKHAPSVKM